MIRRTFLVSCLVATAMVFGTATRHAQAQRPITPPLGMPSFSGSDIFRFYCAGCHGPGGKGDGPAAAALKRSPPDLTTIAARNEGRFPSEALVRYVAGDSEPPTAHGSREMPVWGPIFSSFEPHDRLTRIRIENVVAFIETLQKP